MDKHHGEESAPDGVERPGESVSEAQRRRVAEASARVAEVSVGLNRRLA
ncbi:hypothetical protein [Rhodococcus sp. KRD197]|nr:hypothetical protein [Rhodococcus sp. KRD197]